MRHTKTLYLCGALAIGLLACTPPNRPQSLSDYETLCTEPSTQPVSRRFPKLQSEADGHYRAALKAFKDEDVEAADHRAKLAELVWRIALVRDEQRAHEAAGEAAKKRAALEDQKIQSARMRLELARSGIARQIRLNEMQARLDAERQNTRRERRAGKAKTQLDAAAARISDAERLDAAKHAKAPLAEAQKKLTEALDAFEGGNYPEADETAQEAWRAAETAIGISRPKYDEEQAARALAARFANLVEAGTQIEGATAHLEARGVVVRLRGLFPSGKSTLTEAGQATMAAVTALLTKNADLKVLVEGHTDNRGRAKKNLTLSQARAEAVVSLLKPSGAKLTALGRGDEAPVADNSTKEGRAANRRVDVVLLRP